MQLSIELLPAPLGPMIARISCSRTSKLMSESAFTPPKLRLMFLTSRITSPMRRTCGACGTSARAGASGSARVATMAIKRLSSTRAAS
jgi:hypothetical protein